MTTKNTFESSLLELATNRNLHQVFSDFLVLTISGLTQNHSTPLYMETFSRYSHSEIRAKFPLILQHLMNEISTRSGNEFGNDVLGEFYESHFSSNDENRILSWKECLNTIQPLRPDMEIIPKHWPVSVLDVGCRSGRILLAMASKNKVCYEFLGVEYDFDFIMMTALNLLLNFHDKSEVLWVDPKNGNAFKESYHIRILPMGIVRNLDPTKSNAWENYQVYLQTKKVLKLKGAK